MSGWDDELDRGDQGEREVTPDLPWTEEPPPPGGGDRGVTVRGPGASVGKARAFTTYLPVGMCCNFVWNCIAAPHTFGLADANAAWARAAQRRGGTDAPAGAPVYWAGGKHGHIALSVGAGRVRSTDWPAKGKVGEVDIDVITKAWGITYRGWSADFAGTAIPGLGAGQTALAGGGGGAVDDEAIRPGKRNPSVRRFNQALWDSMPADYRASHQKAWMSEASDLYGPVSQQVCFDKYVMLNQKDPKKWPLPTKPVWPGPGLLRKLGLRPD
ncbi:hypothetical protein ASH01_10425 [Terrabacter sp. Soil811]|uniref:hypothetical protein n=1 Tax=Terrabacter sp. Soil811 TaxID=1736419 RepID=UPI0006FA93F7|nr:hypothetical protein [Terrabacter sp. Soil811]KRF44429.1 hypothetical protein ASH01_10425 [Terrabacter sp. Soil811]